MQTLAEHEPTKIPIGNGQKLETSQVQPGVTKTEWWVLRRL